MPEAWVPSYSRSPLTNPLRPSSDAVAGCMQQCETRRAAATSTVREAGRRRGAPRGRTPRLLRRRAKRADVRAFGVAAAELLRA